MRLLLDTHVILWHFEGNPRLGGTAGAAIDNRDNHLFISAASLWEMAIKAGLGKLRLDVPVGEMVAGYVKNGATLLPITPDHAMAVEGMPWHHRDPFDRMLIAQAQREHLVLVTRDDSIRLYDVEQIG